VIAHEFFRVGFHKWRKFLGRCPQKRHTRISSLDRSRCSRLHGI
jgi:hypothetical protein